MKEDSQPSTSAGTMSTTETFASAISRAIGEVLRYCRDRLGEATTRRRALIGQYIQIYLDNATYERLELKYAQRSSSVEGLKRYTAYTNNIGAHFGNHFCRAINTLLQIRQRKIDFIRQRQKEGVNN
ncbi:hypothetical protein G6F55_006652 [Rhizopus delemar]|nr:hypothetical protein G6F55_006652 [Rhizopus delemar]KAG1497384.1 hypothetical protein G6F54_005808 [Rhizopus delemar]KAG1509325.1 hypothetical protein G6F53_007536 [Rhizopus delemar]KAG1559031.1 hypothetical protein G6F49_003968 [Rhizopus delemar]KAG1602571.1 hypothetical protein G6F47_002632 [Rhizopus delemar]